MSRFLVTKKLMVESQTPNGHCYLRLLPLLPSYGVVDVNQIEDAIVHMVAHLGSDPLGDTILTELLLIEQFLTNWLVISENGFDVDSVDGDYDVKMGDLVKSMFESTYRFSWEEIGGKFHIGSFVDSKSIDKEVWNDWGYSARFVLCTMMNPGARIGADQTEIDFEDLFGEHLNSEEDDEPRVSHQNLGPGLDYVKIEAEGLKSELESKLDDRHIEIEKLNDQIKCLQNRIGQTANHQRTKELDDHTINQFQELVNKKRQTNKINKIELKEIGPDDSSSHISRYERKFLEDGTIFDFKGSGKTTLTVSKAITPLRVIPEVVVGFHRTPELIDRESKILKRVLPINGLANPFKSNRLNFLMHFDTATRSVKTKREDSTYFDIIYWISNHKSQSPSQELLYQVVNNTFCLESETVVANPYKLPFIEVGMLMSDDCLAKCFDLIRLEYKSLWFDQLKGLLVPTFHSDFTNFKETKLSTKKVKDPPISTNNQRHKKQYNSSNTKPRSLLSFIG